MPRAQFRKCKGIRITANAADVSAGSIALTTPVISPVGATVVVRDAAGALKAWDGAITITAAGVTVDNTGAVDFADTDTLDIVTF